MIINFNEFLIEGISNVNKEYTNNIYNLFLNKKYGAHLINLLNIRLPLNNLKIEFIKANKKYSAVISKYYKLQDDILNNIIMKFFITDVMSESDIKIEISHELTHLQEFYNKKIKEKNKIIISVHNILNYAIRNVKDDNKYFFVFCDILYNTTSDELNAKISELYFYLKSFDIIDKKQLTNLYDKSEIIKKINDIKNLDFDKLCNGIINKIGIKEIIKLINKLNDTYLSEIKNFKKNNIYFFIENDLKNVDDVKNYFLNWKIVINKNIKKFEKKSKEIIEKVILDIHYNENVNNRDYGFYKDFDIISKLKEYGI